MTAYRRSDRKGAAAVELAVVLPVILLLFFGGFEIGRAIMVRHILEEGARAGCRVAVLDNVTDGDVTTVVDTAMAQANISGYTVTIDRQEPFMTNPDLNSVKVTITVPHAQVAWLSPNFMTGATVLGSCVMPYPADPNNNGGGGGGKKSSTKKNSTKKNSTKKNSTKKSKK